MDRVSISRALAHRVRVRAVELLEVRDGEEHLLLHTALGQLSMKYHHTDEEHRIAIWLPDISGGFDGPAEGMYPRLAHRLRKRQIASLRLDYRHRENLEECVQDALIAAEYAAARRKPRAIIVGHSFGSAVAIRAAAREPRIEGVVALASQSFGTEEVAALAPRPILLVHGAHDQVLPVSCSQDIYRRAKEPKSLVLYPNGSHTLDESRDALDAEVMTFIELVLLPDASQHPAHEL